MRQQLLGINANKTCSYSLTIYTQYTSNTCAGIEYNWEEYTLGTGTDSQILHLPPCHLLSCLILWLHISVTLPLEFCEGMMFSEWLKTVI
jgi:hypothetical protein